MDWKVDMLRNTNTTRGFFQADPNAFRVGPVDVPYFDADAAVTNNQVSGGASDVLGIAAQKALSGGGLGKLGSLALGKAGLAGVPYLGTAMGLYGLGKSLGLFGRRKSVDPYAEINSLARQNAAQADAFSGQLGSLGMDLQTSGREMMERGRSGYLDALMNPAIAMQERAQLASQLGAASRGVGPMVGMLGGPGAAAQYARNVSQYNPALASGLTQIGSNALQRRAQGFQGMAGFGQQDFGQGLGLRQQGFGIGQQGRQGLIGALQQARNFQLAQNQNRQSGINSLFGAAGTALGSGMFNRNRNNTVA